jgi:hypothetical protein
MKTTIIAAIVAAFIATPAIAERPTIDEHTKCAVVHQVYDETPEDEMDLYMVNRIGIFVKQTLAEADGVHILKGQKSILTPLDENGEIGVIAYVTVGCAQRLNQTLKEWALEAYENLRSSQIAMGIVKK